MDKLNKNSVSLAGEFAVLSQLALRGYDANMTLGNTKNVDILVSNPVNGRMYKLEVKTNYKSGRNEGGSSKLFGKYVSSWLMGEKHETITDADLFYCFVNIGKSTNIFKFYIVPSTVVANYVKEQHKLWLKDRKPVETSLRQFRIGMQGETYPIPTPYVEKYENNWDFKL